VAFLYPQLEKEEQIHSVDIGNDGSAFVEVLVGSSAGGTSEQDYEVSRTGLGVLPHPSAVPKASRRSRGGGVSHTDCYPLQDHLLQRQSRCRV
jgi:hypothetical protein